MDRCFSTRGGVAYVGLRDRWPWYTKRRSASWPFAELRVADDKIVISSMFGKYAVTRDDVASISRFGRIPALYDGFKFVIRGDYEAVVFWALWGPPVRAAFVRHGWEIVG